MVRDQKYDSNAESRKDGQMIITKSRTEPITIDTLNALLANFATGVITLDELWEAIEDAGDIEYFRSQFDAPVEFRNPPFPESIGNCMSSMDSEAGI